MLTAGSPAAALIPLWLYFSGSIIDNLNRCIMEISCIIENQEWDDLLPLCLVIDDTGTQVLTTVAVNERGKGDHPMIPNELQLVPPSA